MQGLQKAVMVIGSEQNFESYVEQYGRLVLSICYSMTGDYFTAEDLAQETLIAAYKGMDRFDGGNPKGWLCTIAANKCRDYLKSAARRSVPTEDQALQEAAGTEPSGEERYIARETALKLRSLCERLREPYRQAAISYFCEGISPDDLAGRTGENPNTLRTRVYRAREMLKKLWREEYRDA